MPGRLPQRRPDGVLVMQTCEGPMLNVHAKKHISAFLAPLGKALAATPVSPDVVTVVGTIGVAASALTFFTQGIFAVGALVTTVFVLSDLLDGLIARSRGTASRWGAFLDSSLDRVADSAIFGALIIWYASGGHSLPLVCASLGALVGGSVTSYTKARAEGLGLTANVGIAERAERLILILVGTFFAGVGVPYILPAAIWILAGLTVITSVQRFVEVFKQSRLHPEPLLAPIDADAVVSDTTDSLSSAA